MVMIEWTHTACESRRRVMCQRRSQPRTCTCGSMPGCCFASSRVVLNSDAAKRPAIRVGYGNHFRSAEVFMVDGGRRMSLPATFCLLLTGTRLRAQTCDLRAATKRAGAAGSERLAELSKGMAQLKRDMIKATCVTIDIIFRATAACSMHMGCTTVHKLIVSCHAEKREACVCRSNCHVEMA